MELFAIVKNIKTISLRSLNCQLGVADTINKAVRIDATNRDVGKILVLFKRIISFPTNGGWKLS
jgi:hypothetical protein